MITITTITINLLLGLITSFSPCLFPLLPTYFAVIIKSERSQNASQRVQILSALALMSGVLVVFFSLTLFLNVAISSFLLQNYVTFAKIQSIILIIAGIFLVSKPNFMSSIQLPDKFYGLIYGDRDNPNPYRFSFLIGLGYTLIAAPCAGGYFLAVWGNVLSFNLIEQFLLISIFSFGAGLPFLLIGSLLPRINQKGAQNLLLASERISLILGSILIFIGIYLFVSVAY